MRTLILLRHAKSSWDRLDLDDIDRPLAPRGRKAARAVARHMKKEELLPDLVLCSPAVRVRETFELICEELGQEVPARILRTLYLGAPSRLLASVARAPDEIAQLMLIGHNPGLGSLAVRLAGSGPAKALRQMEEKFPTAALAVIVFDADRWSALEPGSGRLKAFVRPKDLA